MIVNFSPFAAQIYGVISSTIGTPIPYLPVFNFFMMLCKLFKSISVLWLEYLCIPSEKFMLFGLLITVER